MQPQNVFIKNTIPKWRESKGKSNKTVDKPKHKIMTSLSNFQFKKKKRSTLSDCCQKF